MNNKLLLSCSLVVVVVPHNIIILDVVDPLLCSII